MSLDIRLEGSEQIKMTCGCCGSEYTEPDKLYSCNITHNLGIMAKEAGIYVALWRPYMLHNDYIPSSDYDAEMAFEDSVTIRAKDIIAVVGAGLSDLRKHPDRYKKFDSPNGWGTYGAFLPFVMGYYQALTENPDAIIKVSR